MLTRRELMGRTGAALMAPGILGAAEPASLTVGILEFGTVGWEIETIRRFGLDGAVNLRVDPVELASNDAARIAFLGGAVDTIVSDLLWAARLRSEGRDIVFLPFSTAEGAVMVPAGSPIRSVADLAGARLGVAGGPLDKSWLLLQAMARQSDGIDLSMRAKPAFGAPPLLSQKLEAGELDAALLFWNFCARLEAKGFHRLLGADEMAKALGAKAPISFLGYVFDQARLGSRAALLGPFAAASRAAKARLGSGDDAWATVRPMMQADDGAVFESLKRRFIEGIPRRSPDAEAVDAERLFLVLAALGGEKLVGAASRLPPGLYWTGA